MSETRKAFEALQGIDERQRSGQDSGSALGTLCVGPAGGGPGRAVSGRRVRSGGSNQPSGMEAVFPPGFDLRVEPFQLERRTRQQAATGISHPEAAVGQERRPRIDVYDESDHVLVIAELPGVEPDSVRVGLSHDILELSATAPHRRYRAELLLPQPFGPQAVSHHLRRDLLSIRLQR